MDAPDWYPEWRHQAVHLLMEKQARLEGEFRMGQWPRWDYDIDRGTLIFSEKGKPKVIADIQIVGTTSFKAGNWLWAWDNAHFPADRVTDAEAVLAFGQQHGIGDLIHPSLVDDDLNALGWEMTAVAARITDAMGAYRPPHDNGALYLLCKTVTWAS